MQLHKNNNKKSEIKAKSTNTLKNQILDTRKYKENIYGHFIPLDIKFCETCRSYIKAVRDLATFGLIGYDIISSWL